MARFFLESDLIFARILGMGLSINDVHIFKGEERG